MIDGKRVLAFIPARGGSKGIPHKNIQDLAGTPLIGHTIKAALNCPYVDACMVSTDDDEIARVAHEQGGWVPFLRPIELATDTSKTIDCLDHAVKKLAADGTPFDIVCLLQATSPFRTAEDLTGAIRFFSSNGYRGVASVSEVTDSPVLMRINPQTRDNTSGPVAKLAVGTYDAHDEFIPAIPRTSTVRRQDMPTFLRVNGAIYINLVSDINPLLSLNDNPLGYIIPKSHALDIDEPNDLALARFLMKSAC